MSTQSWRINVNQIDKTQTVGTSPDKSAATAFISGKGHKDWKWYDQGSTQKILDIFGYPSVTYPAIQDVIDVNKHSGTWLCAPSVSGLYGGVNVTTSGTFPFNAGTVAQSGYTPPTGTYFTLYSYNTQADDLQVQVSANTTISGAFDIIVQRYDAASASYVDTGNSPYTVGLLNTSKDGNGNNIYINNVFDDEEQLFVASVVNSNFTTFTNDSVAVKLAGGSRGSALTGANLVTYYDLLLDTNKYPTNLIFDTTADPAIAAEFSSLRASKELSYTSFALPTSDVSAATIIAAPSTYKNSVANRGIFYYCLTWGLRTDVYQGNNFNCSNMGLIVSKIMDCMINDSSEQPIYFNENGLCGGQLDSGLIKLNQTATQTQLKALDLAHFNPIVIDPQYGAWIVGARTTQSQESVYAYIAQSIEADLIIRDIVANVLTPQQGKANDDYHRAVAKSNTEVILSRYARGLDAFNVKCDRGNNTDAILNQQKFILSVAVRYVGYAFTLTLNFVTTPFGIDVSTVLNS